MYILVMVVVEYLPFCGQQSILHREQRRELFVSVYAFLL